jgi:transposase-like protein
MKNPVYEQIQAGKVKARLRVLQHAQRISGNVSQTCRFFGVSRALFYIWKEHYQEQGVAGLRDLTRRPHKKARSSRTAASRLTSSILCQSSSESTSNPPAFVSVPPTLFTKVSSPPHSR